MLFSARERARKGRLRLRGVMLMAALCVALPACGGVTDEPLIVSTLPPRVAPGAERANQAELSPEVALGAQLFAVRCTSCHGDNGQGDGALVRAGQLTGLPDFTQPETMSVHGLDAIYEVVTAGRIDKMMPPWEDALTEAERRAVAAFVDHLGSAAPGTSG